VSSRHDFDTSSIGPFHRCSVAALPHAVRRQRTCSDLGAVAPVRKDPVAAFDKAVGLLWTGYRWATDANVDEYASVEMTQ